MMSLKYTGPTLRDLTLPATFATRPLAQRQDDDGRRQRGQAGFDVVEQFRVQWLYVNELDVFINRRDPATFYKPDQFNKMCRPFSDVVDTAAIMHRLNSSQVHGIIFHPGKPQGVVAIDGKRMLNTYIPPKIESKPGNPLPFLRYLRHLIPDRQDRRHTERWIATILARPDIRMLYALMLMSSKQGVGKSTLADEIFGPLLGRHNCSSPSPKEVTDSEFTDWVAAMRLIVIDEVYAGHSAQMADALKPRITGRTTRVNKKFMAPYEIENFAHFIIMSNSRTPLFMDRNDRRWFVPTVTEKLLPVEYWQGFHRWLGGGGLSIILHWAQCFVKSKRGPEVQGAHAPATGAKSALIEASLSDGMRLIRDLGEWLVDRGQGDDPTKIILPIKAIKEWYRHQDQLSPAAKKLSERAMLEALNDMGLSIYSGDDRVDTGKRKLTAVTNFRKAPEDKWPALARDGCVWGLSKLMEEFDDL